MSQIAAFTCSFFDLTLHVIADMGDQEALHLGFSHQHHERALHRLAQRGMTPTPASAQQRQSFCDRLVRQWLEGAPSPMSPATPFFAEGTPFQQRVWQLIGSIPFGHTATYGELARRLGNVRLSRAVGQACNANPLALQIPCHRVVGTRDIGGFAGGNAIKLRLLALEHQTP